ncbi:thioredoxin domain-containing protein 17-like [Symsagittifera roscoffensis]|uniref:thioredoxin domain-containing protein 17-like n=1 Tax=Symsagittifera roscoffensis TaxID=84072 RepID=UPI00307B2721
MREISIFDGGVDALDAQIAALNEEVFDESRKLFVLYLGNLDPVSGESWCSDCNQALPVLKKNAQALLGENDVLISCGVGEKEQWKNNPENEFRVRKKLTAVPTLVELKTERILVEEDCSDKHLVPMMFKGEQ